MEIGSWRIARLRVCISSPKVMPRSRIDVKLGASLTRTEVVSTNPSEADKVDAYMKKLKHHSPMWSKR
jgi:hypothetical protein